ncbi:MAG: recombinase family protein [Christensenellales bacterium]
MKLQPLTIQNSKNENIAHIPRVCCLYRVSTKRQSEEADIPMQRIECHKFCNEQNWQIVAEFSENGVSGFKVSANKRDDILEIKKLAQEKAFDKLLVFKFDRLGRIESETPFVVEWFINHGIEVWSQVEGQQRIETHADKLINYIRFWQAAGESINTSLRVKTRCKQLAASRQFTGGVQPIGYKLVDTGLINSRGLPIHEKVIDEKEANLVRTAYELCITGKGTYQIAYILRQMDPSRKWSQNTVLYMLKNIAYTGRFKYDGVVYPKKEEWVIVSDEMFELAQKNIDARRTTPKSISTAPRGKHLLTGLLFCGHCGSRMCGSTNKDLHGSSYRYRPVYRCYAKIQKRPCDGYSVYNAQRIEQRINDIVHTVCMQLDKNPKETVVQTLCYDLERKAKQQLKDAKANLSSWLKKEQIIKDNIMRSLMGEQISFHIDTLDSLLNDCQGQIRKAYISVDEAQTELNQSLQNSEKLSAQYDQFNNWCQEYDMADVSIKKMILASIFDKIYVDNQYRVNAIMSMTAQQFGFDYSKAVIAN